MRIKALHRILLASLLAFASINLRAADEAELITILQSSAGVPAQCQACQQLRTIGTVRAVPALAALLTKDQTSHAARYALEAIPAPEAGAALRAALGQTTGPLKVGVMDSLGWRRDSESLPLLKPLLADSDPMIAAHAAAALGEIGGPDALAALSAARNQSTSAVQTAVAEALLKCAERLRAGGDSRGAATLYRSLFEAKLPLPIRAAAWRGLVLSDPAQRVDQMTQALAGTDRLTRVAALKLIRELGDAAVIKACVKQWASLPADSQVAVLDASLKLGAKALPAVRAAAGSAHLTVRIAAWQALAGLEDSSLLPALAQAAAQGAPAERDAARDTLTRLRGPGVDQAILKQISQAEPPIKAVLLRALGERGDRSTAKVLLKYASNENEAVRLAALASLKQLALPDTLTPLLDLASQSKSERERTPVLEALSAVCLASTDKEQSTRQVLAAMDRLPVAERRHLLPLLAELGTPAALTAAQAASQSAEPALAREGVRALTQWPNAAAAPALLELARSSADPTLQLLALSGGITVAEQEPDLVKRFDLLQQAMATAKRPEEKRQALGQLGQIPTPAALQIALAEVTDSSLANEAGLAAVTIAEKLAGANPQLADEAAVKVLAHCQSPDTLKRAWVLRRQPNITAPFIQDWLVCGPYRQPGAAGAGAGFDVEFGPEKPGEAVAWKSLPRGDQANLGGVFPDQNNCVAYLQAQIIAPQDRKAVLLVGSDDGVKAWLNGALVLSHNIDRGMVPDQDMALIDLKKGTNQLGLKITQGSGGWMACARIVSADGLPIAGMSVAPQGNAPAVTVQAPKPPPTPVAAMLPPRDNFKKVRLSDQFYAEGAYFGDFNRDGKLDIVAGPFWFEGPDFAKRHEYRAVTAYDPKDYSDNFLTYAGDCNGDGWTDIVCVPWPGKEGYWFENPTGQGGPWKKHLYYNMVGNESPVWGDVTGDGKPELLFNNEGYLGYAGPDTANPTQPWVFRAVSGQDKRYQRYTHGIGYGDINGDKRVDMIEAVGWWEQPAGVKPDQQWIFHPFHFADAGAQMLVYDVNGDGLSDIITAWHCHNYGLVWWQQVRKDGASPDWEQHIILPPKPDVETTDMRVSQLHAFDLVDMNGDGVKDIVTGKRYWAHGPSGDPESSSAPAVVLWFEIRREAGGKASFIPHLIDDDSGVGTQVATADLNGDGRPDVIVSNKKGIFVHLSEPARR